MLLSIWFVILGVVNCCCFSCSRNHWQWVGEWVSGRGRVQPPSIRPNGIFVQESAARMLGHPRRTCLSEALETPASITDNSHINLKVKTIYLVPPAREILLSQGSSFRNKKHQETQKTANFPGRVQSLMKYLQAGIWREGQDGRARMPQNINNTS